MSKRVRGQRLYVLLTQQESSTYYMFPCLYYFLHVKQKRKPSQDEEKNAPTKLFPAGNCFQCMKYCTVVDARITFIIIIVPCSFDTRAMVTIYVYTNYKYINLNHYYTNRVLCCSISSNITSTSTTNRDTKGNSAIM